jgi:hypothetical protein
MTEPLSLGHVLYEQPDRASYEVVRDLTSSPTAFPQLGRLTRPRRHVAELELVSQMTAILRRGLSDLVLAAWTRLEAVQDGAAKSRRHPSDPVFVPLADHRASRSFAPALEVYLAEVLIGRLVLQARVELFLTGVILKFGAGRIVGVGAGTWSGVGSLAANGTELARRSTGPKPLPGAVTIGDGFAVAGLPVAPVLGLVMEPAPTLGPATIAAAGTVIIGRHPSCQVILADDSAVAAHHAVVYPLDDLVAVEDLGSSTGTWFNGQRLRAPAILHVGDEIAIGRHHVRVIDRTDDHVWAAAPDAALTA